MVTVRRLGVGSQPWLRLELRSEATLSTNKQIEALQNKPRFCKARRQAKLDVSLKLTA